MTWNMDIPSLSIELLDNGNLRLEDKTYSEFAIVDIHPMHLRLMAERLGLVRDLSASEADALRMVDKLGRRIKLLHERIKQMDEWLCGQHDYEQADITLEVQYSDATLTLADEFVREIAESGAMVTPHAKPSGNPAETQRVIAPKQHELNV